MEAPSRIRLFGSPRLLDEAQAPVRFRTRKHLALLIYLYLEGRTRPVDRDRLVDLLWPDTRVDKGRHSLSQGLVAIRERLGSRALSRRERDVQFLAELPSDLTDLDVAADLSEPLRGLEDCGGVDFAHWVDGARATLIGLARDGLRGAVRASRQRGDLSGAHRRAAQLHRIDPLCADAVCALAERALLDGDSVTAVRLLQEQVRRAQAELGTNPNPEIAQLLRRLARGDRPTIVGQGTQFGEGLARREVFVGRDAELARLEATWERTVATGFRTCLITGAPGIGKSSLVRRFATSLAARAWPVFVVNCQEIGNGIPYAAVSELLMSLGRDPSAGGTDPLWLSEASRVCPALRGTYPGIPEPPNAPTDSIRLRVAEAVLRMMEAVAEDKRLLVAFDDVHNIDPASRDVVYLVTRRLERVPTLLLATTRTDNPGQAVDERWVREVLRAGETVDLAPLGRAQTLRLISDLAGGDAEIHDDIRATIVDLAQGNPYHVEMLVADWKRHQARSLVAARTVGESVDLWNPPDTLRSAFASHYGRLSANAQRFLEVLAVAGRAMTTSQVAELVRIDIAGVEQAAFEILDRGIARVDGGRFSFKNEVHRAYVYYAMREEHRSYHHTRLASLLVGSIQQEDFQRALEASHHFIAARMPQEALDTALAGAELATRRGAPREAEHALAALQRSYPQPEDSRLHIVLADALVSQGRFDEALAALSKWLPRRPSKMDAALAEQLRAESLQRARISDDQTILQSATRAVTLAEAAGAPLTLIRALQTRAEVAVEMGQVDDADAAAITAEQAADSSGSAECAGLAAMTRGYSHLVAGRLKEAINTLTPCIAILRDLGLLVELRKVQNGLGICYTGLGRLREAAECFAASLVITRKLGDHVATCNLWSNLGVTYHEAGAFSHAAASYDEAVRLLDLPVTSSVAAVVCANVTRLATELGDIPKAENFAAMAFAASSTARSWRLTVAALGAEADLHLARGEPERAWPLVEQAIELTRNRSHLLYDKGQFERLRLHFVWSTKGFDAANAIEHGDPNRSDTRLIDSLQFAAFRDWMFFREGNAEGCEGAFQEIEKRGLYGLLSRLHAVGVRLANVPEAAAGESSAQLVARTFRLAEVVRIPRATDLLESSDGFLGSS